MRSKYEQGLYFEEVVSLDHALGLVLRGLAGQKLLPCDAHPPQAKYHTLIYVDILAHVKSESWRSRVNHHQNQGVSQGLTFYLFR